MRKPVEAGDGRGIDCGGGGGGGGRIIDADLRRQMRTGMGWEFLG